MSASCQLQPYRERGSGVTLSCAEPRVPFTFIHSMRSVGARIDAPLPHLRSAFGTVVCGNLFIAGNLEFFTCTRTLLASAVLVQWK